MGINDIFSIATRGIAAQRQAIEVTSENIANVNTAGYSRQRVIMESGPANIASSFPIGGGVEVVAIQRSYDNLLQTQVVNGNSTYEQNLAKQTALEQVEPLFNEVTTDGLGKAMESFFGAWQDLSLNPQGSPERQAMLARSQILVDTFHQLNTSLNTVITRSDQDLVSITADISDKLSSIAQLNQQIMTTQAMGGNVNEMKDQRDYLIQELSGQVGVTTAEQANGTITVSTLGGETLVSGNQYRNVVTGAVGVPPQNHIYITDLANPPTGAPLTDVTATIGGAGNAYGKIGGTLQVRDDIVPGYLGMLNELAGNVIIQVNTQHRAGTGLGGTTNEDFFTGTTSADIAVRGAIVADPAIIAAGANPTTGPGDNRNALLIAGIKDAALAFSTGNSTVADFFNAFVSNVGVDVQQAKNTTAQGEAFLKQLNTLRESNSGVSLDEELTNLLKYQRAFEGAARLVKAGGEMMDTILAMVR
ncbi:flagellar hook-associated protein FlgK [Geotalea sp. SG265]|uniref:flagellar hook-associated protein FlgK n=1 Tax=Geotalea sp. SG265 TaxID=2922867 RepID=UPI001FAEF291|nr:flagellar hook-associated protein FlgK [Geotalea sp. SG265]